MTDKGGHWGTDKSDELLDVLVAPGGRLVFAGYEHGSLDASVPPEGDALGVIWTVAPGSPIPTYQLLNLPGSAEVVEALTLQPGTNALHFAARTTGAFPGFKSGGRYDVVVGDVGPDGKLRVRYQGGSEHPQHPTRLTFDPAGDLVVAGYDDDTIDVNYLAREEDPFVLKLHAGEDGALQASWWNHDDTDGSDQVLGLGVGSDGAVYVSGGVLSGAQDGPFLRKLDAQGQALWNRRVTPTGFDMIAAVHVLPGGDLLVAGSTFHQLGEHAYGQQDAFVQRRDGATGEVRWTTQLGTDDSDWVTDLAVDPVDGSIVVVGETPGTFDPAKPNAGEFDVFLARLSADGQVRATQQWGSAGDDHPAAVAVDPCGRAFIVGYTTGDLAGPSRGSRDAFVLFTETTRT
ncbi:hypothetical protein FGE12_24830 [Aggregicoccus sp. 17bor-14]|nr:hypothetical protein [Simulacricoccus sp. 17bor-14]MRI91392.1 hypothetical protein [Aggregicoccus sp. 17bor-14]